jgi:4-amino-4-deoxy-L-arabinose transferase-like glycosyltransferase
VNDRRALAILTLILIAAALIRLHAVLTQPYVYDEEKLSIPLAQTISFSPGEINLPFRGPHHPALPSYFVKMSSAMFGQTQFGYRALHLAIGLFTILVVFRLAREWYGPAAACWAAALLAFNEYHVGVSAYATAKGPHLFFLVLAVHAFAAFLRTTRPAWLYAAGVVLGLAFYCKEHSALLLPVFLVTLAQARYRRWLFSPHTYLAAAAFFAIIAPDILWNVRGGSGEHATYSDQLSRIGGLGFSLYPFLFFAHAGIRWLYLTLTGSIFPDEVAENPSMNDVLGVLLFGLVCYRTFQSTGDALRGFLLNLFWIVFGFFVLLRPGQPTFVLDPAVWYWVDVVLFAAVILAGQILARGTTSQLRVLRAIAIIAMVLAVLRTTVWWPFAAENLDG